MMFWSLGWIARARADDPRLLPETLRSLCRENEAKRRSKNVYKLAPADTQTVAKIKDREWPFSRSARVKAPLVNGGLLD
jgi:hypothetical protein